VFGNRTPVDAGVALPVDAGAVLRAVDECEPAAGEIRLEFFFNFLQISDLRFYAAKLVDYADQIKIYDVCVLHVVVLLGPCSPTGGRLSE
jgi:hypothetical protein